MIICNLRTLMAERGLVAVKVSEDTGISRTTLSALYNNSGQGIQFETLNTLCGYLGVEPGDLFTFLSFEITVGDFHYMSDSIPFIVSEVRRKPKTYTLPFDVDTEDERVFIGDEDNIGYVYVPKSATARIGAISVSGDEPTKEERAFWSYYNKLPIMKQSTIDRVITEKVQADLYQNIDSDAYGVIVEDWEIEVYLEMESE